MGAAQGPGHQPAVRPAVLPTPPRVTPPPPSSPPGEIPWSDITSSEKPPPGPWPEAFSPASVPGRRPHPTAASRLCRHLPLWAHPEQSNSSTASVSSVCTQQLSVPAGLKGMGSPAPPRPLPAWGAPEPRWPGLWGLLTQPVRAKREGSKLPSPPSHPRGTRDNDQDVLLSFVLVTSPLGNLTKTCIFHSISKRSSHLQI